MPYPFEPFSNKGGGLPAAGLGVRQAGRPAPCPLKLNCKLHQKIAFLDILAALKDGDSYGVAAGCLDRFGGFLLHRAA